MAEDVAPVLLEKIKQGFEAGLSKNETLQALERKLNNSGWGFLEAEHYALEVGKELSGAFLNNLSSEVLPNGRMYYNIARRVIPPMMLKEYELSTDAALEAARAVNEKAGIRIAPQKPLIDEDRISGIVDKVSGAEYFDDVKWMLGDPVQNFAVHCVDRTVEQNALFQHRAGLRPRIKRDSGGKCCDWCAALDGMYEYPGVPRDIFMRHENCNCTVEYLPGDGRAQDVYSKEYRDLDAIEERKAFSERALDADEARERIRNAENLERNRLQGNAENAIVIQNKETDQVLFHTRGDPMVEVTGPAEESNPAEIMEFMRQLDELHVELIRRDYEDLGYAPALFPGNPGQCHISKGASYSAWRHEMQHVYDDRDAGWSGYRILQDKDECIRREQRAYSLEIEMAERLGRPDIAERLRTNLQEEVSLIRGQ